MDREQRVCPDCGQPVQSVVRRHKTLGAWVPRWVPGPCHNPECTAYVEPGPRPDAPEPDGPEPADVAESGQGPGAAGGRRS
ncbi:hypothetical protein SAMN04487983_104633 [Streptomyces sp. yr375]|uniref:hypothetical protein n=1 Tax=Streptomyces sp. yr375 TaxID=1761906 RepID=UPI0008B274D7|nr:hypothetical protein [Streptomyces sp. yr375]SES37058.1 hypothetical protein SAMN04487983_104633 [Streptomyces sp. yr375]